MSGEVRAGHATTALLQRGINAGAIFAPVVPAGTGRLRFFLTGEHTERQFLDTAEQLAEVLVRIEHIPDLSLGAGARAGLPDPS
ncbi:hypothetical protein [Nocardia brevicatena]|uniref:hypothetical protein n=1 Tax=Nocardia brevicatena TaxID=37327 RepID=UPI0003189364|nr:hypothetical protein [Nocardia brevicatena]